MSDAIEPTQGDDEPPVPTAWRPVLTAMVDCLVAGDYTCAGIDGVEPASETSAEISRSNVEDYDDEVTLVPLPAESWDTSIATWQGGYWEVLVDLFTEQDGRSDLVLHVKVTETADGYSFSPGLVYVP